MIEKEYDSFLLYCDICGGVAGEDGEFDTFYDVVKYKKQSGWKSQYQKNRWWDVCPGCQEAE